MVKLDGYRFFRGTHRRLRYSAAILGGVFAAVSVMLPTHAATIPDGMQWGVTFGFYATNGYFGSVEAKAQINAIAKSGATWVTVVPTVWQDAWSSTSQYKDFAHTPDDIELMDAIDLIHAKGMKVQLRPMLECKDGNGRLGFGRCLHTSATRMPIRMADRYRTTSTSPPWPGKNAFVKNA